LSCQTQTKGQLLHPAAAGTAATSTGRTWMCECLQGRAYLTSWAMLCGRESVGSCLCTQPAA
jgi:hypothetical protein